MPRTPSLLIAAAGLLLLSPGILRAADPADSGEARLRETLRSTMLQLREAQSELAGLQASQASQADERKALDGQIALLKKHAAEDRAASEKSAGALKAKLDGQASEIARLNEVLAQWKVQARKEAAAAQALEARLSKETARSLALGRRVEDLETKNATLFLIGNEILTRYEKFGLGQQFLAREPFVGRTRVALENQIQDYGDKLLSQRAGP